jgi:hypothetical protein
MTCQLSCSIIDAHPARLVGILAALVHFSFPAFHCAEASAMTLNGYSKTFLLADQPVQVSGLPRRPGSWTVFEAIRLKFAWIPDESISFNIAYGIAPKLSKSVSADEGSAMADSRQYRNNDIRPRLYPGKAIAAGHFTVRHNIDRAYARLSFDHADLFLGRQAIAWGSARVVNPTDVIAPYPFGELDTEERIGVDALRAVIMAGEHVELNAGYISGKDADITKSAVFLRGKTGLAGTDVTVCATKYQRNLMAGLDLARSIAGAGAWLETAYTRYDLDRDVAAGSESFRLSCGLDYNFGGKLYAFIEYHYNGDGEPRAEDYGFSLLKPGYHDGPAYLMARHYAIPSLSYQITPLITSITNPLVNLDDGSVLLSQQCEYNTTQNTYLSLGAYLGFGKTPVFSQPTMITIPRSEFGSYSKVMYLSFRKYF